MNPASLFQLFMQKVIKSWSFYIFHTAPILSRCCMLLPLSWLLLLLLLLWLLLLLLLLLLSRLLLRSVKVVESQFILVSVCCRRHQLEGGRKQTFVLFPDFLRKKNSSNGCYARIAARSLLDLRLNKISSFHN